MNANVTRFVPPTALPSEPNRCSGRFPPCRNSRHTPRGGGLGRREGRSILTTKDGGSSQRPDNLHRPCLRPPPRQAAVSAYVPVPDIPSAAAVPATRTTTTATTRRYNRHEEEKKNTRQHTAAHSSSDSSSRKVSCVKCIPAAASARDIGSPGIPEQLQLIVHYDD